HLLFFDPRPFPHMDAVSAGQILAENGRKGFVKGVRIKRIFGKHRVETKGQHPPEEERSSFHVRGQYIERHTGERIHGALQNVTRWRAREDSSGTKLAGFRLVADNKIR